MLSKSSFKPDKISVIIWLGILSIYLFLWSATGYLSFLQPDLNPSYQTYLEISKIDDQDSREFLLEILQKEESEHLERSNLARQSFHIVLGAFLGFMSASAASLLRKNTE